MITVRVVSTLVRYGRHIESVPKVYTFDTQKQAEDFAGTVNEMPQNQEADNYLNAYVVQETAYLTQDATPVVLHHIALNDVKEEGEARFVEYHGTELYTVAEIEDFRNTGKHPAIVYAYDNPNCIKPALLTEEEFDEGAEGGNYYFGSPGEEFFLSFNPEILNLLKVKYGISDDSDAVTQGE